MSRAARLAWPIAAALLPVLIAGTFAGGHATLAWRDTGRIMAPVRPLVADAIRHGRLPLWNPYVGAGAPLLGDSIHGVLHPLSLVAALFGDGVEVLLLLYLAAAALGAFLAARAFGASPAASAAAAVGYGASGVVLGTTSMIYMVASAASIPWVVAAARVAGKGGAYGVPLLSAAVASSVLSGDAQAAALIAAVSLAIAVESGGRGGGLRAAAGVVLGMLLAGIQILPTWHVMQRSLRVLDLDATTLHQWALHPWRVLELVIPGMVGGEPGPARLAAFMVLEPAGRYTLPFLPSVFIGAPLVAAAFAGAGARAGKLLAIGAGGLLWLALGHWLGAQQALSGVPVWKSFRYSEKLVCPLALALALLAALGVDAIAADRAARRRAAAGLLLLAVVASLGVEGFIRSISTSVMPPSEGPHVAAAASAGLLSFTVAALAVGLWLAFAGRRPAFAATAFAGLVVAQAIASRQFGLLAMPDESLRHVPVLEAPPPGPRITTPAEFGIANVHGPEAMSEQQAMESEGGAPDYNVASRVDNIDLKGALYSRRYELMWAALGDERWLGFRRYGVTHVALPVRLRADQVSTAASATRGGEPALTTPAVRFVAVPHRPWAFFAEAVRAVPSQLGTLEATMKAVEQDLREVVLETASAPPVSPGRIVRLERGAERVTIEAEAEGAGVLVVNDAYWPGWFATIDGAPAEIIPADVLVRAIPFPAGRHRLEMRYAPPEVAIGMALSAVGVASLAAWVVIERGRRRAAPGTVDGPRPHPRDPP